MSHNLSNPPFDSPAPCRGSGTHLYRQYANFGPAEGDGAGEPARATTHYCDEEIGGDKFDCGAGTSVAEPRELCPENIEYYECNDARNREVQRRIKIGWHVVGNLRICNHCLREIQSASPPTNLFGPEDWPPTSYCWQCLAEQPPRVRSAAPCTHPLSINLTCISNPIVRAMMLERGRLVEQLEERCGQQHKMNAEERAQLLCELEELSTAHVRLRTTEEQVVMQQLQLRLMRLRTDMCFHQTKHEIMLARSMEEDRAHRLDEAMQIMREFVSRASPAPSSAYSDFDSQAMMSHVAEIARAGRDRRSVDVSRIRREYTSYRQATSRPTPQTNSSAQQREDRVLLTNLDLKLNQFELAIIRAHEGELHCQLKAVARIRTLNNAGFGFGDGANREQDRESLASTAASSASVHTSVSRDRHRRSELVRETVERVEQQQAANANTTPPQRSESRRSRHSDSSTPASALLRARLSMEARLAQLTAVNRQTSAPANAVLPQHRGTAAQRARDRHRRSELVREIVERVEQQQAGNANTEPPQRSESRRAHHSDLSTPAGVLVRARLSMEARLAQLAALNRQAAASATAVEPQPRGTTAQRLNALFDQSAQMLAEQVRFFETVGRVRLATDALYSSIEQPLLMRFSELSSSPGQPAQAGREPNTAANTHPEEPLHDVSDTEAERNRTRAGEPPLEVLKTNTMEHHDDDTNQH